MNKAVQWQKFRWLWQQHMAWPGVVALAGLMVVVLLITVVQPGIEAMRAASLQAQVRRLQAVVQQQGATPTSDVDRRDAWLQRMPQWSDRAHELSVFYDVLESEDVSPDNVEFSVQDKDKQLPGVVSVGINLRTSVRYADLKGMIAGLLNALPTLALDGVTIEAKDDGGTVQVVMRWTLLFREVAP